MEANNVIEYRPTAKFLNVRVLLISYLLMMVISSFHQFVKQNLMDWQPWFSLIALLGVFYLLSQPQKKIRMRISPKGIEFRQPQSGLLSPLNDIPQHEIAKIQWIVGNPKGRWSLQRASYVILISRVHDQHGKSQMRQIHDEQWQSDSGQSPSSLLAEYFPDRIETVQQNSSWRLSSPVADPNALELGKLAEYCMLACVVGGIVGFLLTFLNPYEALTWGSYGDVTLVVAAVIASITLLSFMLSKIKILAKIINALIVVPFFAAAMILLLHGVLMLATDTLSPAKPVLFELTHKTEQREIWRTVQDLSFKCDLSPQPLGAQKTVSVKQGWFGVKRLNPSGLCNSAD